MKINESLKDVELKLGIKKWVSVLLIGLLISNVVLVSLLATSKKTHRETFVPPNISRTFWVDDDDIDPIYLQEMGRYIATLALNNTPINCDQNRVMLLKYVHSASYGVLNRQIGANCETIRAQKVSSYFEINTVQVDPKRSVIIFNGVWNRWANSRKLPNRQASFRMQFKNSGSKVLLASLDEVQANNSDKFSDSAVISDPSQNALVKEIEINGVDESGNQDVTGQVELIESYQE